MDLPVRSRDLDLTGATSTGAATYNRQPLSVRVSARERHSIEEAAATAGLVPSAFVRRAALRAANQPVGPVQKRRDSLALETARCVGALGRIANSANQIAKASNCGRLSSSEADYTLERLLRELTELRATIVKTDEEG